jgi:hypothetical protein
MKNLTLLPSCTDVIAYARAQWKTDVFRRLQDEPGSYLQQFVDLFAGEPRIYYDMDDPELERNHFTVWMNAIQRRDGYSNPYLEDMYNLHEMAHAVDMKYDSHSTHFDWSVRSLVNELKATIETEVVVYFAIPGLREKTFPFEIWADRFLRGSTAPTRSSSTRTRTGSAVRFSRSAGTSATAPPRATRSKG